MEEEKTVGNILLNGIECRVIYVTSLVFGRMNPLVLTVIRQMSHPLTFSI